MMFNRHDNNLDFWFRASLNCQMANVQGEIARILSTESVLDRIRREKDFRGPAEAAFNMLEIIKIDPKNLNRLPEILAAERNLRLFLYGGESAPSQEKIKEYWDSWLNAYIDELKGEV